MKHVMSSPEATLWPRDAQQEERAAGFQGREDAHGEPSGRREPAPPVLAL